MKSSIIIITIATMAITTDSEAIKAKVLTPNLQIDVSDSSRRPVESQLRISKNGVWLDLGATRFGRFFSKRICGEGEMLKAVPIDSSFYGSSAVVCENITQIVLRKRPNPELASNDESGPCSPVDLRSRERIGMRLTNIKTSFASLVFPKTFLTSEMTAYPTMSNDNRSAPKAPKVVRLKAKNALRLKDTASAESRNGAPVTAGEELVPTDKVDGQWWEVTNTNGENVGWINEKDFIFMVDKYDEMCL